MSTTTQGPGETASRWTTTITGLWANATAGNLAGAIDGRWTGAKAVVRSRAELKLLRWFGTDEVSCWRCGHPLTFRNRLFDSGECDGC